MLDIRFIRENLETVSKAVTQKGDKADLPGIVALDDRRIALQREGDELRAERNRVTMEIAKLKKAGQPAEEMMGEMRQVGDRIKALEDESREVEAKLADLLMRVPNVTAPDVPEGDESHNVVTRTWGTPLLKDGLTQHLPLGTKMGCFDFERGAKLSGGGFPVFRGLGAKLERALIHFMLELHIREHGYTEVSTPFVVNRKAMTGTGQLPKMEEDMYHCTADDLFLIPTAEVPVTNLHADEMLDPEALPIKYCAYSPCFRREAGSYGKDTRGFLRVHQFNKVELVKFATPETSWDELESLLANAEEVLRRLDLPYRIKLLATGDLSFASAKTYDIEVWAPAEKNWLEVSSCSNFTDFQARRANIRYRPAPKEKPRYVHTLNGSGVATSRLIVALYETYQNPDGSVTIPEPLRAYMGCDRIG